MSYDFFVYMARMVQSRWISDRITIPDPRVGARLDREQTRETLLESLVMGIFSRFRDIVTSNLNAMLDKAEDPEKMIKLMIQEMEDTLIEIKASCARTMASRARVNRALEVARSHNDTWGEKAQMALGKGREDLAREALVEKRNYQEQIQHLEGEARQLGGMVEQYQADIQQLEEKLDTTRKKHRLLVQRHLQARKRQKVQGKIRQTETSDALVRFDQFENRIERMEAEASLVNVAPKPNLEEEFRKIKNDDEIEKELEQLKQDLAGKQPPPPPQT
jgi:phage shock protein A